MLHSKHLLSSLKEKNELQMHRAALIIMMMIMMKMTMMMMMIIIIIIKLFISHNH